MPWWGWLIIGSILLGAELAVIEAEFFLVFLGVSALLTGVSVALMPTLPVWSQWIAFATISLLSMVFFRKRVYGKLRPNVPDMAHDMEGDRIRVPTALAPGETCRIEYRGTTWSARNDGAMPIAANASARIVGTKGITLQIAGVD